MTFLGKAPYPTPATGALPATRSLATPINWKGTIADNQWQPLGNDTVPDCTVAAADHMMMCWTTNSRSAPWQFSPDLAIDDFNNYRNAADSAAMQHILDKWQSTGLRKADGSFVTIDDFALLDINHPNALLVQVQQSIGLLGGCAIGIQLPKYAVVYANGAPAPKGQFPTQWNLSAAELDAKGPDAAKDPKAGHAVNAVGFDGTSLQVVTWGNLVSMSWDFFFRYMDEAWVVLCQQAWLKPDGTTPSGRTKDQLVADFVMLKGAGRGQ